MTGEEAKRALVDRCPIMYNDIVYLYVDEIIYRRNKNGGIDVYLRIADKCGHSMTQAPLKDVKIKE